MTVKEVAIRLEVSRSLVYSLCSAGKILHERYGLGRGCIRISEEALADFHKRNKKVGGPSTDLKHIKLSP